MTNITPNHFQLKKKVPDLKAGDRVRVHQKISEGNKERIQIFEGLVIKVQGGNGINGSFTVRRITLGVGVEKTYPLHLPTIVKIEKLKSAKVRRAKLYYVRGLIGKKASRLKREKKESDVWEDVIEEETQVPSENDVIAEDQTEEGAKEEKEDKANQKGNEGEDSSKAVEQEDKPEANTPEDAKEEECKAEENEKESEPEKEASPKEEKETKANSK